MIQLQVPRARQYFIRLYVFLPVVVLLLLHCTLSCNNSTEKAQLQPVSAADSASVSYIDSISLEFTGEDSLTVLQLLEKKHQVQKKSSALGIFITGIDSIENRAGFYWMYSVNDSMGDIACDKYVTKPGDKVRWVYRKFIR